MQFEKAAGRGAQKTKASLSLLCFISFYTRSLRNLSSKVFCAISSPFLLSFSLLFRSCCPCTLSLSPLTAIRGGREKWLYFLLLPIEKCDLVSLLLNS